MCRDNYKISDQLVVPMFRVKLKRKFLVDV